MGKPIHPATVHFPIAFLALSWGIDILNHFSPNLPRSITSNLAVSTDLSRASYYLLSIGLISAIPSLVTGGREAIMQIQKQGIKDAQGNVRTKSKIMIAHAVSNDIVFAAAIYIWYLRRSAAANTVAGKLGVGTASTAAAAYQPLGWMVGVEAAIMVLMFMSANMGGTLAYVFGMGFSAGGSSAKKAQ